MAVCGKAMFRLRLLAVLHCLSFSIRELKDLIHKIERIVDY